MLIELEKYRSHFTQYNHVLHLPIKMLCRLSSLTSVPYKQFSLGKTIIIHYFHQNGQLTDISTPQHPSVIMKHNKAQSLLSVSFHLIFTLVDLLSENIHVLLQKQRRELLNSEKRINVQHGQARCENAFCFFNNTAILQTEPGFHFTDFSSPSNQKSKKQMDVRSEEKGYRHNEMKPKGKHRFL